MWSTLRCVPAALGTILVAAACATTAPRTQDPAQGHGAGSSEEVVDPYGPQPGQFVASVGGSFTRTSITTNPRINTATISTTLRGGYYLTRSWEVGLQGIGTWSLPEDGQDIVILGIEPYASYNFQVGERTWMFTGPHLGVLFIDTTGFEDTAFAVGAHLGVRHWVSERTSFFTELRYSFSRLDLPGQSVDHHETEAVFGLDIGF